MEKPKQNFVTFWRAQGNYNLCDSKQIDAQYGFNWGEHQEKAKELGLIRSFTFGIDYDNNYNPNDYTALELAYELENIYKNYWIHSDKTRVKNLIEFLESIEESEQQKKALYNIEFAKYQIEYWQDKLIKYENLVNKED